MSHRRWVAEARESFPARARAWKDVETSRACNESDRGHQPLPLIPKSCGAAADPNFLNRDEISTVSLKTLSKLIALALVTFPKRFRYRNNTRAVWIKVKFVWIDTKFWTPLFIGLKSDHRLPLSQIFSFTRFTEPNNIQLVPNIQKTSFHQPVKRAG